jgi:hypothetical protein
MNRRSVLGYGAAFFGFGIARAVAAPVDKGLQGGSYNAGRGGFNVGGKGGGGSDKLQNSGGQEWGGGGVMWPGKTNQGGWSKRPPSGYNAGDGKPSNDNGNNCGGPCK